MKPFTATLLAAALSAAFASASAADAKPDQAQYRNATAKASADLKVALNDCKDKTGQDKLVCQEEAKVAQARSELNAVTEYNNTKALRTKARTKLANAEFALAKVSCATQTGNDKQTCLNNATSVHTAALADARADRDVRVAANVDSKGAITNTAPRDADKRAAVEKCEKIAGDSKTGCLIDNKGNMTATTKGAAAAGATVAARTENAAERAAEKTGNLAERAVEKTKEVAKTVANKTEHAVDKLGDKTEKATDTAAAKTERAADKTANATENVAANTGVAVSDAAITTKVKASLFKEPGLKAMSIDVDTDNGVVTLNGMTDTKAEAAKAVKLAKEVEGVKSVKSNLKVK